MFNSTILSYQSAINVLSPLSESLFLVRQTLSSEVSRSCCSTLTTMWNDNFSCTLFSSLWAWTVTRHTRCLSDRGPISVMLILIDNHWLTSCNPIWILLVYIWVSEICIQSKWHSPSDILPTRLTRFSSFIYYLYVTAQYGFEWICYTLRIIWWIFQSA